ncbi:hypothetical protein N7468_000273 [Penicillium chermesinum]|uniref:IgE-binding protein n=1 Tax=Penicillium chermesinum TaxID=63820 RepID=A0A9W9PJY9_9EURO|nr:uncharacterized protein N7468_000273 [Penicillium chermesinum]KAJ5248822.1 hypothetical protein N7468_000273 [Penicillium chermesinum]
MKFSALLAAAPLAAATAHAGRDQPAPFSVTALRSGSPIHFAPLNAAGDRFYLGGKTVTFCPDDVGVPCDKMSKDTIFSSASTLSPANATGLQDVSVPGGQSLYVDKFGAVGFTTAHSVFVPPGSELGPFSYKPNAFGNGNSEWTFGDGFMACPVPSNATASASTRRIRRGAAPVYQVFAARDDAFVPTGNVSDCLGFDALAVPANGTQGAWQYV